MSLLKRKKFPCRYGCGAKVPYGKEYSHQCYPDRDKDEAPENRPELHHRKDAIISQGRRFGTDKTKKQKLPTQQTTRNIGGTATVGVYLPEVETERKRSYQKLNERRRKSETINEESASPKTEARYESPADVRNLDHTKNYPHAYREEGYKYGSPCSHDGFDDKSTP